MLTVFCKYILPIVLMKFVLLKCKTRFWRSNFHPQTPQGMLLTHLDSNLLMRPSGKTFCGLERRSQSESYGMSQVWAASYPLIVCQYLSLVLNEFALMFCLLALLNTCSGSQDRCTLYALCGLGTWVQQGCFSSSCSNGNSQIKVPFNFKI